MTIDDNATLRSGIDLDALDAATRPQDDLYRHVNGRWIDSHEIPADRARDGAFRALHDRAEEHVRDIIVEAGERAAAGTDDATDPQALARTQVGAMFASFMDTDRIAELGTTPLEADLAPVRDAADRDALTRVLGSLQRTGAASGLAFWVDNDAHDPESYVVYLMQSGLGLPDESYYREEQHADKRAAYVGHVERMLALAGWPDPAEAAARVMALETRLAAGHWDKVTNRDPVKTYTLLDLAGLTDLGPQITWSAYLDGLGAPANAFDAVVVRQPDHITSVSAALTEEPVQAWRDWLAWHVVHAHAPYLASAFVEENFDFYGRTLSGVPEMRERWKRGVGLVEEALGEAVGQLYVERHFPPHAKEAMVGLVDNLVEAFRRSLSQVPWMGEDTRREALAKLGQFTPKIGYPQRWRDYGALEVRADDLLGNVRRAVAFEVDRQYAKLGGPVDRDEWFMTPQTVNAYYNPGLNEIVFPAAILQPPFFDVDADDAVNYGGIGGVIGHEIGHGFDDQGSKYDGAGRLEDWWTAQDRTEFEARTTALIAQYDAFVPAQLAGTDHHVNGALTIGENIGDLGGLSIAFKAYRIALGGDLGSAPVIDGLTGAQRVLLGWAQVWQTKARDEEAIRLLAIDPHSPAEFRCNGIVSNVDEFYDAFDVAEGDALYLAPEERVRIW